MRYHSALDAAIAHTGMSEIQPAERGACAGADAMPTKVWIALGAEAVVFGALLFGGAGTFRWPAAWAFLFLFFTAAVLITLMIARHDPALLDERMKPIVQKDQPLWDRIIMSAVFVLFIGWLVLMGLDAVRFGWSVMPAWLQAIGGAGVALSMWLCSRVFRENTFLAPVVKIQSDRGQTVISTGPYAVVRHPMYAAALILFPSIAIMLGSWYGVATTIILASALVVRTALEDRELHRKLDGYPEYAARVRSRLIPRIW
jgi:protein-S-isoprenylcysteine O-methyltransferase Ste14